MKEIDPVVAALADKLWHSPEVPPALPGQEDALVQALKLNRQRSGPSNWQPPGMMLGPEWLGLNFPLAEAISPAGAHMVQGLLGGSGTGDDGLAQFMPGAGDAIDAWTALRLGGQAIGQGLEGNWSDAGQLGSWAAIAAMGAVPGYDAPPMKNLADIDPPSVKNLTEPKPLAADAYELADQFAADINAAGFAATPNYSGSAAGKSAYMPVTYTDSIGRDWRFGEYRVSDHGAPSRMGTQPMIYTGNPTSYQKQLDALLERKEAIEAEARSIAELAGSMRDALAVQAVVASNPRDVSALVKVARDSGFDVPKEWAGKPAIMQAIARLVAQQ